MINIQIKNLIFTLILVSILAPAASRAEVGSKVLAIENILHQIYFGPTSSQWESLQAKEIKKNKIKQGAISVRLPTAEEMKVIRANATMYDSSQWQGPQQAENDDDSDNEKISAQKNELLLH